MSNPALRVAGPCSLLYKGATFFSQGDVDILFGNDTFDIAVDALGVIDKRSSGKNASTTFVPMGDYANLSVLYPHQVRRIGDLTTPVRSFDATAGGVTIGTDIISSVAHGFSSGAAVRVFPTSGSTIPTGLVAGTLYYLNAASADTFSLHTTRAAAVAGTGKIDITVVGTGRCNFIEQEPMVITSIDGTVLSMNVAAVSQMPRIKGTTRATLFGSVSFDFFRTAGVAATTANSLFTISQGTYTDPAITPASILTQPYTGTWGAVAPWVGFETLDGFTWDFPMSTTDVTDDTNGLIAKRISDIQCTVTCTPLGVQPVDVMTALLLQGAGAGIGASLAGANNFVMNGTGVVITATNAAMKDGAQKGSRTADRIGDLTWFATRKFIANVPQPMFSIA
jgi:hypothetical protein